MIELEFSHYLTEQRLVTCLGNLTLDPDIARHVSASQRSANGLAYRFSGPSIEAGFLGGRPASTTAPGSIIIKLKLKGLARLASNKVSASIKNAAIRRINEATQ